MLAALSEDGRADAWAEIEQALAQFERDGEFEAPCELIVAAGTRRVRSRRRVQRTAAG